MLRCDVDDAPVKSILGEMSSPLGWGRSCTKGTNYPCIVHKSESKSAAPSATETDVITSSAVVYAPCAMPFSGAPNKHYQELFLQQLKIAHGILILRSMQCHSVRLLRKEGKNAHWHHHLSYLLPKDSAT